MRFEHGPFSFRVVIIERGHATSGFTEFRMKGCRMGQGAYAATYRRMDKLYLKVMSNQDSASIVSNAISGALASDNPPLRILAGKATLAQQDC